MGTIYMKYQSLFAEKKMIKNSINWFNECAQSGKYNDKAKLADVQ